MKRRPGAPAEPILNAHEPAAKDAFEQLSFSNRKRHVLAVGGAKTPETRQRRIAKTLDELRSRH